MACLFIFFIFRSAIGPIKQAFAETSNCLDVFGLWAFLAFGHGKLYTLAFCQGFEA